MIVMVTHGRGAFGEFLFGSQTKAVLAGSTLPLLVLALKRPRPAATVIGLHGKMSATPMPRAAAPGRLPAHDR